MGEILNNTGLVALLGTIFGGAGLKVTEHFLNKARQKFQDSVAIRDELRTEINNLRSQLAIADEEEKRLEGLVEEWRGKYYDLRDEKQKVLTELTITLERLKMYERRLDISS